jgi:hypothetical protein
MTAEVNPKRWWERPLGIIGLGISVTVIGGLILWGVTRHYDKPTPAVAVAGPLTQTEPKTVRSEPKPQEHTSRSQARQQSGTEKRSKIEQHGESSGAVGGSITTGPCSNTQVGGKSNQGSVNCGITESPDTSHLTAQCYLELFGQIINGTVPGMIVNQTPEPMDDVRMDVTQLLDKSRSDPDPNPNSKIVGWEKRIEVGTCRARLMDGLDERFPIGNHDHLAYSVWITSRYWTFREDIDLNRKSNREYSEKIVVYRGGEQKPMIETETSVYVTP